MYYQQLSVLWTRITELYLKVIKTGTVLILKVRPISCLRVSVEPAPTRAWLFRKPQLTTAAAGRAWAASWRLHSVLHSLCSAGSRLVSQCTFTRAMSVSSPVCPDESWEDDRVHWGAVWWQYETNFMLEFTLKIERSEREPVRPVNSVARR